MPRRKAKLVTLRKRVIEQIDALEQAAEDSEAFANDLKDLLEYLDEFEPREKQDNIIPLKKEAE